MFTKESDESIEFWKTKKEEVGKDISFKSFTRFYGEAGNGFLDLTGLIFATDDTLFFEDFEKSSMFSFFLKKKKKSDYKKFTMNIPFKDIKKITRVTESSTMACVNGKIPRGIKAGAFSKLAKSIIWEFELTSGRLCFFEIFEYKRLFKLVNASNT